MAFPLPASVTETQFSVASTTHNVSMPATVSAGDLLLILLAVKDNVVTLTTPTGWTLLYNKDSGGTAGRGVAYAKVADGTEGGTTVNVATSGNTTASSHTYRVTSWDGTIAGVEAGTANGANSGTSLDPPSLTPSWGSADTLWIATCQMADDDELITGYPTSYTGGTDTISGGGVNNGCTVGSAYRQLAAAAEDPGAFTVAASEAWAANTIAVRPASASAGLPSAVIRRRIEHGSFV